LAGYVKKLKSELKSRGPKKKISDIEILAMVKAGKTHIEIAKEKKINPQTVRNQFDALGLERRDCRHARRRDRVVWPFSVKPETIDMINDIAAKTKRLKGEVIEVAIENEYKKLKKHREKELMGI